MDHTEYCHYWHYWCSCVQPRWQLLDGACGRTEQGVKHGPHSGVITGTIGVAVFSHADSFWTVPVAEQSKGWSMDHTVVSLLAPLAWLCSAMLTASGWCLWHIRARNRAWITQRCHYWHHWCSCVQPCWQLLDGACGRTEQGVKHGPHSGVITGTIGVAVFSHADSFWTVPVAEQSKE